jgi:hypothetical protein
LSRGALEHPNAGLGQTPFYALLQVALFRVVRMCIHRPKVDLYHYAIDTLQRITTWLKGINPLSNGRDWKQQQNEGCENSLWEGQSLLLSLLTQEQKQAT